tara:strand:+ start:8445 stop:8741 length:297 start_codon:yes stop_codon:yes gene_type:complete
MKEMNYVKYIRKDLLGWNQTKFASWIQRGQPNVCHWEKGKVRPPKDLIEVLEIVKNIFEGKYIKELPDNLSDYLYAHGVSKTLLLLFHSRKGLEPSPD